MFHLLFSQITSSVRLTCQKESPYFDLQRRQKQQLQYFVLKRELLPEPSLIIFILSSSFLNFITLQVVKVSPHLSYQCTLYSLVPLCCIEEDTTVSMVSSSQPYLLTFQENLFRNITELMAPFSSESLWLLCFLILFQRRLKGSAY